jgi:hypothetical protein
VVVELVVELPADRLDAVCVADWLDAVCVEVDEAVVVSVELSAVLVVLGPADVVVVVVGDAARAAPSGRMIAAVSRASVDRAGRRMGIRSEMTRLWSKTFPTVDVARTNTGWGRAPSCGRRMH